MCFFNFLLWKASFIFCLCYYLWCQRGNNLFDVFFRRIRRVIFPSKDGKTRSVKEEMDGEVFISRQSWHFSFRDNMNSVLLYCSTCFGSICSSSFWQKSTERTHCLVCRSVQNSSESSHLKK